MSRPTQPGQIGSRLESQSTQGSLLVRAARGLNLDPPLLIGLLLTTIAGLFVLYSASGESIDMVQRQAIRIGIGFCALIVAAQFSSHTLRLWTPWLYLAGVVALLLVMFTGETVMGAQRWLDLGFISVQPSELLKIGMPMMIAWYFHDRPLPPRARDLLVALVLLMVPVLLIAEQPDLGTAVLVASAGGFAIYLSGVRWRVILLAFGALVAAAWPVYRFLLHDYQRERILTFLNPERDPLGAGYHIIQSKIAVGSGGLFGKGWLNGTQSQLDFLPERHTDFIFAVLAEELGLIGILVLLLMYSFLIGRGLQLALRAEKTYERLLGGALAFTFFVYVFVNIGMVCGILPVVGVPLPLISYGGTSMVTLLTGFGILMSLNSGRSYIR
ncbi:MAG TPA: rod shape-determining protein RodA [Gammaproteobacteria bacterium]|nr:rod shape-determining protein RodA [Gammaproteobacteria bacterium]